jgi:hypothetical protein
VDEALTLLRILSAIAIDRPVRQQFAVRGSTADPGEWLLHRWSLRRPRVLIVATATAAHLRANVANARVSPETLEALATALGACTDTHYRPIDEDGGQKHLGPAMADALDSSRKLLLAVLIPRWLRPRTTHYATASTS